MTALPGRARSRKVAALAATLALAVAACTGGDDGDAAPDPGPRPPTTTTTRVDLSGVALAPVPGETTTTVPASGRAAVVGTVRGPGGPVAGATVRIERIGTSTTDVVTDEAGRFEQRGIPGGRYRVRAFLPPILAQQGSEVRFLADDQEHGFDLELVDQSGPVVSASAAPDPAQLDQPVNLVVQIGTRRVDGDGVVITEPVPGLAVELEGLGRWQLFRPEPATTTTTSTTTTLPLPGQTTTTTSTTSTTTTTVAPVASATATTDQAGRARWALVCRAPGAPGLGVRFAVRIQAPPPPPTDAEGAEQEAPTTTAAPTTRIETATLQLPTCIDPTAASAPPAEDGPGGDGDGAEGGDG